MLRVAELFAGVGGFRLGLEGYGGRSASSRYRDAYESRFKVVWSNQWEPKSSKQVASEIYAERFGPAGHTCCDINTVDASEVPEHDVLVAGFPCQDYSVASLNGNAKGISGSKGSLWWQVNRIVAAKQPTYIILENVDNMLKKPTSQRGRDFAVILKSLVDAGYGVEWRVVNAADYGMPQKRRRVFLFAAHRRSPLWAAMRRHGAWMAQDGLLAKAFPHALVGDTKELDFSECLDVMFDGFSGVFESSGVITGESAYTVKSRATYVGTRTVLRDIVEPAEAVDAHFVLAPDDMDKWRYLKGAKRKNIKNSHTGEDMEYSEGAVAFPDSLDAPARTIITSEGGKAPSRSKHVISSADGGALRRLMPLELERINMFPDDHTRSASDGKRAFLMGNALVVGVVEKIGRQLAEMHCAGSA